MDWHEPKRTDTGECGTPPTQEEAQRLAALLEPWPNAFVSFQTCGFLALNPDYSNEVTPQAVYGFPVDFLHANAARWNPRRRTTRLATLGCVRRPNAFVFSVSGRVLELSSYRGFLEDSERLDAFLAKEFPSARGVRHAWTFNGNPRHGTDADGRRMLGMTEHVVNDILGIQGQDATYKSHPDKPALWRRMFAELGFAALLDLQSQLTGGDFPRQIAVFDDSAITVLSSFANPCAAPAPEPEPAGPGPR